MSQVTTTIATSPVTVVFAGALTTPMNVMITSLSLGYWGSGSG